MFHLEEFWYLPYSEDYQNDLTERVAFNEVILIWIHSEEDDKLNSSKVLRKTVKNARWMVNKTNCETIILHSFVHLSDSKSDLEFTEMLIKKGASRLLKGGLDVHVIPSGLNEFSMHVKGPSLSKVFKAF
jgi:hypothetical protein